MRNIKSDASAPHFNGGGGDDAGEGRREKEWELRPGGMLVQKRTDADEPRAPPPTIRVRVKFRSIYHEIHVSSQATFGELKKILSGPTGLHHQDQKLFYKGKEKDSKAFLDTAGVKDKSKIVLEEDLITREKRHLEMRKNDKIEKAAKFISEMSSQVDKLAKKVSAIETVVSKGGKVVEKDIVNLTDMLMNQLLKLDGIIADGDVKLQKKTQEERIKKCVETLDLLKLKNSTATSNGNNAPLQQQQKLTIPEPQRRYSNGIGSSPVQPHRYSNGSTPSPVQKEQDRHSFELSLLDSPKQHQQPLKRSSSSTDVVITTEWETFESAPTTSTLTTRVHPPQPPYTWDLL